MNSFLIGFADELAKIGQDSKVVPKMPQVTGGKPEYSASGSFKPDSPKVPKIEPMKLPGQ